VRNEPLWKGKNVSGALLPVSITASVGLAADGMCGSWKMQRPCQVRDILSGLDVLRGSPEDGVAASAALCQG